MFLLTPENAKLAAVATACLVVGTLSPSVAATAHRALVPNADKVDGFHAVGAGTHVADRRGRLVATNRSTGRLPNNIIAKAPDAALLDGQTPADLRTEWISFDASGNVYGASPGAAGVTATHPAAGTYCVDASHIVRASVAGTIQSQVNGFTDITMVVTSLYNTSACNGTIRIYTAQAGALADSPFTLTFDTN